MIESMVFEAPSLVLQTRKATDFSLAVAFHIETRALHQLETDVTKAQSALPRAGSTKCLLADLQTGVAPPFTFKILMFIVQYVLQFTLIQAAICALHR